MRRTRSRSPRLRSQEEEGDLLANVSQFIAENGIDEKAADVLLEQPPDVQRAVLEEGFVTGRNVSASLMGRIKRVKGGGDNQPRSHSPVTRFVSENSLDARAETQLREQSFSVKNAVIQEGPLTGRNPSAVLSGRIRRILDSGVAQQQQSHFAAPMAQPMIMPRNPPPAGRQMPMGVHQQAALQQQQFAQMQLMQQQQMQMQQQQLRQQQMQQQYQQQLHHQSQRNQADPVGIFVAENGVDQKAEQQLREQPHNVQQAVLSEGPLTGRNPSAVLAGRIRRILDGGGGGPPAHHLAQVDHLAQFINENSLDHDAEMKLREQPPHVQQAVLSEGPLTGRNPSAVLSGRIRRIHDSIGAPVMSAPSPAPQHARPAYQPPQPLPVHQQHAPAPTLDDEVRMFAAENGIDDSALRQLLEAPPAIQQAVIEEGNVTGRNPSAILLSRLRRAETQVPVDTVASFVIENKLDAAAESRLKELAYTHGIAVQQAVMNEGPLSGAKNPSAVLAGRIKRVVSGQSAIPAAAQMARMDSAARPQRGPIGGPSGSPSGSPSGPSRGGSQGSGLTSQVCLFVADNAIDEDAAGRLLEAPEHIQRKIIEEGPCTGRNPSAILLSRLKRANTAASTSPSEFML